jgi:hypothetical protein
MNADRISHFSPLYARAPRGQRAYGAVPRNWGTNTPLVAGLTLAGIQAPMILEGAVDMLAGSDVCRAGPGTQSASRKGSWC